MAFPAFETNWSTIWKLDGTEAMPNQGPESDPVSTLFNLCSFALGLLIAAMFVGYLLGGCIPDQP